MSRRLLESCVVGNKYLVNKCRKSIGPTSKNTISTVGANDCVVVRSLQWTARPKSGLTARMTQLFCLTLTHDLHVARATERLVESTYCICMPSTYRFTHATYERTVITTNILVPGRMCELICIAQDNSLHIYQISII